MNYKKNEWRHQKPFTGNGLEKKNIIIRHEHRGKSLIN